MREYRGGRRNRLRKLTSPFDCRYSIADMATFPWLECIRGPKGYGSPQLLEPHKNVTAYLDRCLARPAVKKGMSVTPFPERK